MRERTKSAMSKWKRLTIGVAVFAIGGATGGCSFSASTSAGSKATIVGKDKIVVTATRPPAPEPEPKPEPKTVKPRKAKVVGKRIEITEKVMFEYDKATIKVESHQLLNDVAAVMAENPKIKKVRIAGHTDSDGSDDYNKKLSQDRADAVMKFLVDAGIDPKRLEAKGYGEQKPIADNKTEEGKERNRRVEFNITHRAN